MTKRILCALILCALVIISLPGCDNGQSDDGKLTVAVSIIPVEGIVKAICGELADVVTMIPSGSSPETYEPTPRQMVEFSDADVYFAIGVPSEDAVLGKLPESVSLVRLDEACTERFGNLTLDGGRDPHIWLSARRVSYMADKICEYMVSADAEHAGIYRANTEAYKTSLKEADEYVRSALEGIRSREFVVFHPAFNYFAKEYDLTMYALEEGGKEATAKHLAEMVDFANERGIKAVFYQAEVDSRQAKAFADEIGGKTVMLSPLDENIVDNLKKMADIFAQTK